MQPRGPRSSHDRHGRLCRKGHGQRHQRHCNRVCGTASPRMQGSGGRSQGRTQMDSEAAASSYFAVKTPHEASDILRRKIIELKHSRTHRTSQSHLWYPASSCLLTLHRLGHPSTASLPGIGRFAGEHSTFLPTPAIRAILAFMAAFSCRSEHRNDSNRTFTTPALKD